MKYVLIVFSFIYLASCSNKNNTVQNHKVFNLKSGDSFDYIISKSYPEGNYKTDRLHSISKGINPEVDDTSYFIMNFNTKNILNGSKIDSAFVYLHPLNDGMNGNNTLNIFRVTERFKPNFSWNVQPKYDNKRFGVVETIKPNKLSKVKVDVTELLKDNVRNRTYDFPIILMLNQIDDKEYIVSGFHSSRTKETSKKPSLEVYYSK